MTDKTYWNSNGTHQALADQLRQRIPTMGPVAGKQNKALEAFRKAGNAYYDIFNNGGMNRTAQIRATFGIAMSNFRSWNRNYFWDDIHAVVEPKMDELVLAAAKEQGIL